MNQWRHTGPRTTMYGPRRRWRVYLVGTRFIPATTRNSARVRIKRFRPDPFIVPYLAAGSRRASGVFKFDDVSFGAIIRLHLVKDTKEPNDRQGANWMRLMEQAHFPGGHTQTRNVRLKTPLD